MDPEATLPVRLGLTWGLSACTLGLDEAVDVGFHTAAFQRHPNLLIELEVGKNRG